MKRYSIGFVILLLIVSVFAMSCEDVLSVKSLSEEDVNNIAKVAMGAFMHTGLYIEASVEHGADPNEVGNDGLVFVIDGNDITIEWTNYDIGAAIKALLADGDVDEDYQNKLLDLKKAGQVIIISGTATGTLASQGADIRIKNMKLKINDLEYDDIEAPNGTYDIELDLSGFASESPPLVNEIKVNGIYSTLEAGYFQ